MTRFCLILSLFTVLVENCMGQPQETKQVATITMFIHEIKSGTANETLIEKFLKVSDRSKENLEFVNLQLDGLREELKNVDTIRVSKYDGQSIQLILSPKEKKCAFIVWGAESQVFPFLMKNYRISSFSTLNKGGKRIFLLL